jgi:hypothetical protein
MSRQVLLRRSLTYRCNVVDLTIHRPPMTVCLFSASSGGGACRLRIPIPRQRPFPLRLPCGASYSAHECEEKSTNFGVTPKRSSTRPCHQISIMNVATFATGGTLPGVVKARSDNRPVGRTQAPFVPCSNGRACPVFHSTRDIGLQKLC